MLQYSTVQVCMNVMYAVCNRYMYLRRVNTEGTRYKDKYTDPCMNVYLGMHTTFTNLQYAYICIYAYMTYICICTYMHLLCTNEIVFLSLLVLLFHACYDSAAHRSSVKSCSCSFRTVGTLQRKVTSTRPVTVVIGELHLYHRGSGTPLDQIAHVNMKH